MPSKAVVLAEGSRTIFANADQLIRRLVERR